jgi:hypothetical protein
MLAEQQKRSNIGVGFGLLLEVGGRFLMATGAKSHDLAVGLGGIVITIAGVVLFIWGCFEYAKGKGQSPWLGLLGFLSCIGLIILICLPDNYKNGGGVPPQSGGYGGGPGVWPPPPTR